MIPSQAVLRAPAQGSGTNAGLALSVTLAAIDDLGLDTVLRGCKS